MVILRLAGAGVGAWARWRRWRGRYDRHTLRLHWCAWRWSADPRWLVRLAGFRRDLGRPLPARWRRPLEVMSSAGRLGAADRQRVADLLRADDPVLCGAMQVQRGRFAEWLAVRLATNVPGRSRSGVCVVGNAGLLRGAAVARQVDAHSVVVRFNDWHGAAAAPEDVGVLADVWVVSPAYRGPVPSGLAWAVVTGPDPVAALERWPLPGDLRRAGVPVLTVPLEVWRAVVSELAAPPTAGVLTLAWLRQLCGGWRGVGCVGIGEHRADVAHHLIPRHPPGRRHAWVGERALVARWRAQGLQRWSDL